MMYHRSIPKQLHGESFRFIRVLARDKRPIDSEYFDQNNYPGDNATITDHLDRNGNYGLFPVAGAICILDIDDVTRCEQLGIIDLFIEQFRTFMVRTGSGGLHIYFRCPGMLAELQMPKRVPFFDPNEPTRHLGEIYPAGCRAYVVGPGSVHPNGNTYEVLQDAPIEEIPFDLVIANVLNRTRHSLFGAADGTGAGTQFEKRIPVGRYTNLLSDELGLRIEDFARPVNGVRRGSEIQGGHPVHGSSTGHNFSIDTRRNLWHCFRCDSGGDVITWIAVDEGFIDCSAAGHGPISEDVFKKVRNVLITKYGCGAEIEKIDRDWRAVQRKREQNALPRTILQGEPSADREERGLRFKSYLSPDNLVEQYVTVASSMTDAYPEFHYAGMYALLSAATNRCAVVRMNHGDIYSNVWSMCLGISTVSRKSTALKIARDVARYHATAAELPASFTPEALIEELADTPRIWWFKDEIGTLLSTMQQKRYMAEMRDFLNELYENQDYRRKLRTKKSKERSEFNINAPYTTFLFATTPETFSEQTNSIDLTSGWLLRFLYFYPAYYKASRPYMEATQEHRDRLAEISSRLGELFTFFRLSGRELEFIVSRDALAFFQSWQRDIENYYFSSGDTQKLAQYGRLFSYALKLAMLFKIADPSFTKEMARVTDGGIRQGQQIVLDEEFVVEACRQIDQYFAPIAIHVAQMVARQTEINVQEKILSLLRRNGGRMKRVEILRALHIKVKEFMEHTEALIESNEIEIREYQRPGRKTDTWVVLNENQE